jgi:hypothetical protein
MENDRRTSRDRAGSHRSDHEAQIVEMDDVARGNRPQDAIEPEGQGEALAAKTWESLDAYPFDQLFRIEASGMRTEHVPVERQHRDLMPGCRLGCRDTEDVTLDPAR